MRSIADQKQSQRGREHVQDRDNHHHPPNEEVTGTAHSQLITKAEGKSKTLKGWEPEDGKMGERRWVNSETRKPEMNQEMRP
jgi:hypothetical protein